MRLGFAISLTVHVALILWAVLHFERTKLDDVPETVAISVAVVTPSDVTRMRQGDETTKTLESKAADKPSEDNSQKEAPKPKAAPPAPAPPPPAAEPPPPEPAKAEPPKPDPIQEKLAALPPEKAPEPTPPPAPTPDDQAALAAKLEEERKAEAKRKADADAKAKAEAEKKRKEDEARRKKAEEERKKKLAAAAAAKAKAEANKFDPNKLADLINKADDGPQKALIDKSNKPTGAKPTGNSQTATNLGTSAGTREGRDSVLSAREADMLAAMLNSAIKIHWRLPAGGGGVDTPVVQVRFRLRQDGTLDGEPQVLAPQNTPQFAVAAEAAVRAVKEAVPYNLPPDKYAAWADNKVEFDPSKMLQ